MVCFTDVTYNTVESCYNVVVLVQEMGPHYIQVNRAIAGQLLYC